MSISLSKSLKTEIYRKAVHLSSLWMPIFILRAGQRAGMVLFAGLLVIDLLFEYAAYRRIPLVGSFFRKLFLKTLRGKEICRTAFVPSGSVYVLAAALFVSVCYTPRAAAAAMSVMLIADSGAALVGKLFGTFRFYNEKSAEGTLTFFVCAVCVMNLFFPDGFLVLIYMTAILAAAAEFFEKEIGIDDNLSIPLICGFVLNLIY